MWFSRKFHIYFTGKCTIDGLYGHIPWIYYFDGELAAILRKIKIPDTGLVHSEIQQ